MNYLNLGLYLGLGLGPVVAVCLLQNRITTGLRRFLAFSAVGFGFSMLNVGPLGPIIGFPSILMSAGLCTYLTRSKP